MNPPALRERLSATPRLACEALVRAINHSDLEGALEHFAPGACLIGPDGSFAQGTVAIRASLAELIASGARIEIELFGVLVAEEHALAHERWTIFYDGRSSRSPQRTHPTLVLRLLGGEWKLTIAAPWGTSASPPLEAVWP
jgi:ketosteroid isomerase-like protein